MTVGGDTPLAGTAGVNEQSEREPWLTPLPDGSGAPIVTDARFADIAARMFDVVCEIDAQSHFAYVSPNVGRVLGYRPEELLGTSALDLVYPDDRPNVASEYARAVAEGDSGTKAFRARHADGHYVWVEVSVNMFERAGERRAVIVIRDVTERVQVANALLESEQRLQAFASSAPVVMFAADADGVLTLWEGRGLETLRSRPGEYVGVRVVDAARGDARVAANVERALRGETFADVRALGPRTWEVHHAPLRDASGALTGFTGIMVDVTERVRAQRAATERARAVAISSEIGTILVESQSIEEMLQRSAEAVQRGIDATAVRIARYGDGGELYNEVFAGATYDRTSPEVLEAEAWMDRVARQCRRVTIDLRHAAEPRAIIEKAGYREQTSFAIFPLVLNDRAVGSLSLLTKRELPEQALDTLDSIARTLTLGVEQKRAETALRKSEERYRAIYQNHSVVRYLIDEEATIVDINEPGCAFYGYSRDELIGQHFAVLSETPAAQMEAEIRSALQAGRTMFECKHRLRSGEIRDIEVHAAPVEIEGRTLLFCIGQDITERKHAEALLESQRELLEMVAAGAALQDVLERINRLVEEHAPGALCSILLLDEERRRLHHGAAASLPGAYNAEVDGIEIGPDVGACGAAAARGTEVVIPDITKHPNTERFRELCAEHGLRSCWSTPIFSPGGAVAGTFAIYHREVHEPTQWERALVRIATHVAGLAIERERAETALRNRNDELERMYAQLVRAHADLEESQQRLEEKSRQLEAALEAERERARSDPLTGKLNHAAITEALREQIAATPPDGTLALAMVDVDGLKVANDTYGHQVGDLVLETVARRLSVDGAIVGRYGGDEFMAILPGADRQAAEDYRARVLAALAAVGVTDPLTGSYVPVVASVGLAVYPDEAEAVEDLIRLSDSAMYASRRQRRAGVAGAQFARTLAGDRAARMVGEIVPLLTSDAHIKDKLRLVAHRLSVGAGYDAVHFVVEDAHASGLQSSTFARLPEQDLEAWNRGQRRVNARVAQMLNQIRRPIIIDDLRDSEFLDAEMRDGLANAGFRALIIAPMIWGDRVIGAMSVASKERAAFSVRDADFIVAVATQVTAIIRMSTLLDELQESSARLRRSHEETVMMLAAAAEAHDHTTGRHLSRVRTISEMLARELGHDEEMARSVGMAATLHDIGKIRVPDFILGSSDSLKDSEWELMRQHTIWGSAFLSEREGFALAAEVARHHHERWDGGGYPDGIAGEDIPEAAQITTVADSLDAMINDRPYRAGRPIAEAIGEIVSCAGTQFSPRVVDALVRLYERGELAFINGEAHDDEQHDERAAA